MLTIIGTVGVMAQATLASDGFKVPETEDSGEIWPYLIAVVCLGALCVAAFKNAKRLQQT
jgi:hypothetical protein